MLMPFSSPSLVPVVPQLWKQRYLVKRCLAPPQLSFQRQLLLPMWDLKLTLLQLAGDLGSFRSSKSDAFGPSIQGRNPPVPRDPPIFKFQPIFKNVQLKMTFEKKFPPCTSCRCFSFSKRGPFFSFPVSFSCFCVPKTTQRSIE